MRPAATDEILALHNAVVDRVVASGRAHYAEVTPEMIEAGVEAFVHFDRRFDSHEDGVRAVYLAMLRAADNA